ncbi:MAG: hypothetical protein AABX39_02975, partial [Nanoarchaeota archaeon]
KDSYLVDQPIYIMLTKLCSMSLTEKIAHLMDFNNHNATGRAEEIMTSEREEYMLQEIEKREGCTILELKRKGLLVVGYSHAVKYWRDVQATLL